MRVTKDAHKVPRCSPKIEPVSSEKKAKESIPGLIESAKVDKSIADAAEKLNSKGRPTRSRAEAEAARKRPLVPEDRRAAAKAQRAKAREARDTEYVAMKSGDESRMPLRDRGPKKRYIRDFVDARWNVGEYFLIIAGVFLLLTLLGSQFPVVALVALLLMYLVVIVAIVDAFILWRQLKKRLVAKFGQSALNERGLMMYAVMRAFQFRRGRLPKAVVKHGEYPS